MAPDTVDRRDDALRSGDHDILAGPLIDMAADITGLLASDEAAGAAGLLQTQADDVVAAWCQWSEAH